MIPTLKESHLAVYILCLLILITIIVVGTVLFDDQVQTARDLDDKWVLALTVAQRTMPLTIGALTANVILIEFGYFLIIDIPRSRAVKRRITMVHNWLEQRREQRRKKEEQLEQERRLREVAEREELIKNVRNQVANDRAHVE